MEKDYREAEQYQRMAAAIHERLAARGLARAARNGGGWLTSEGALVIMSLGRQVTVYPDDFRMEGAYNMWHELVLLQYLADGDGREPMDRWMGLANYGDSTARGSSFDREVSDIAASGLSSCSEIQIIRACHALGGEDAESMGDVTYNFMFAPHFPLQVLIWLADDEFQASAKVLVDGNAEYYLGLEAAGTAAEILMQFLVEQAHLS